MAWYRKLLIGIACLITLLILAGIGINLWISKNLPGVINENNDSPYHFTYDKISVSLLQQTVTAEEVIAVPKSSLNSTAKKAGVYAKIHTIKVSGINLYDLVFTRKIRAKTLQILKPEITFYQDPKSEQKQRRQNLRSEVVEPFSKIIYVSDVRVSEGMFQMIRPMATKAALSVNNVSLELEGILVSERTLNKKIPFEFKRLMLDCDSIRYDINKFYRLTADKFHTSGDSLVARNITLKPLVSRRAFVASIPEEKDLYAVKVQALDLRKMKYGHDKKGEFFHHTKLLAINHLDANVYRGKMVADDMTEKKFFSRMLREMKFDMRVDTLKMRNSRIVYEEEKDFAEGPGKVSFSNFNMTATNVYSGYRKSELPNVNINVNCRFMDVSPMKTFWTFNVLDPSDGFRIRGSILDFPAKAMAPFTKPYSNTIVEGNLDEVYFDFTGNRNMSKGRFGLEFDDMKVKIYRKNDRKKQNKIVSAIVNLFVKNDSKEKTKHTDVEVDRIREKSFFNLLWRSVADGLKKILL